MRRHAYGSMDPDVTNSHVINVVVRQYGLAPVKGHGAPGVGIMGINKFHYK